LQPVLPPVCRPLLPSRDGSWARPLTQSPGLGAGARCFPAMNLKLCGCRQLHRSAVAQRFVGLSAHPQAMQQHGQLSCGRDHRSFLPILAATLRQLQTPTPQIAVRSKRPQNVVRSRAPAASLNTDPQTLLLSLSESCPASVPALLPPLHLKRTTSSIDRPDPSRS
jgi:hypothetical protein